MSLSPELASHIVADSHPHLLPVSTTVVIGGAERCVYISFPLTYKHTLSQAITIPYSALPLLVDEHICVEHL